MNAREYAVTLTAADGTRKYTYKIEAPAGTSKAALRQRALGVHNYFASTDLFLMAVRPGGKVERLDGWWAAFKRRAWERHSAQSA